MFNLLKDQIKLYENVTSIVTCILIIIKLLKELNLQEYLVAVRFRDKSSRQTLSKRSCPECRNIYYPFHIVIITTSFYSGTIHQALLSYQVKLMYLLLASIDHCGQNSKMTQSGRLNFHNRLIDSLTTDFYFVFVFSFPPMCIYIDSFSIYSYNSSI